MINFYILTGNSWTPRVSSSLRHICRPVTQQTGSGSNAKFVCFCGGLSRAEAIVIETLRARSLHSRESLLVLLHAMSTTWNSNQASNLSMFLPVDYSIASTIVEEHVKEMKAQGVMQDLLSPWNSPIFPGPKKKKDGSFRPVIDFNRVNEVMEDEKSPLAVLKDILTSLGRGNRIFSSPYLLAGYCQVKMAPSSRALTAFSTPNDHFEFK